MTQKSETTYTSRLRSWLSKFGVVEYFFPCFVILKLSWVLYSLICLFLGRKLGDWTNLRDLELRLWET